MSAEFKSPSEYKASEPIQIPVPVKQERQLSLKSRALPRSTAIDDIKTLRVQPKGKPILGIYISATATVPNSWVEFDWYGISVVELDRKDHTGDARRHLLKSSPSKSIDGQDTTLVSANHDWFAYSLSAGLFRPHQLGLKSNDFMYKILGTKCNGDAIVVWQLETDDGRLDPCPLSLDEFKRRCSTVKLVPSLAV